MKENFGMCLADVLRHEGGYVDDPKDPGGATNKGVTQAVYDAWRASHRQEPRDVHDIDCNEVEAIYRELYWDAVSGDLLPYGVDYCIFDFAVNSGPRRAAKFLQAAAGVASDGVIGPITLAAVKAADAKKLISDVCNKRMDYLQTLPMWDHFRRGWASRVCEVQADSELLAE